MEFSFSHWSHSICLCILLSSLEGLLACLCNSPFAFSFSFKKLFFLIFVSTCLPCIIVPLIVGSWYTFITHFNCLYFPFPSLPHLLVSSVLQKICHFPLILQSAAACLFSSPWLLESLVSTLPQLYIWTPKLDYVSSNPSLYLVHWF